MLGDRTFNRTSITKNGRSINGSSIIPIATVIGMVSTVSMASMIDEGARLSLGCRFITISS